MDNVLLVMFVFLDAWIGRQHIVSFLKVNSNSGAFRESLRMESRRLENMEIKMHYSLYE